MQKLTKEKSIRRKLKLIQRTALQKGIDEVLIKNFNFICCIGENKETNLFAGLNRKIIITVGVSFISLLLVNLAADYILSARCLIPINHLVWEAARPLADCRYCANVTKPIILQNVTRQGFREVFEMPAARVKNERGQEPWYVGWGNCDPDILANIRKYYAVPEFLPEDAEFPVTENLFFGYEMGAVMHLDYIPRLMWQGQVRGKKTWSLIPVPECENVCHKFQYYVEPGDVVLLDTRLWYHATSIPKGQFSMTVQSEYG
ncbi:uncharacterized protein LOC120630284 isoform X3 [Pararge aegeria]|uniref:uncharacterized protein LOC120630284 isoform X3 n=1 Tax=Pararge aegeria TaxID=116150 RepID=UPI0019D0DB7B|nr:uncharacterized protein LOC120630284 isoform X3 [Pararge aegeria]